MWWRRKRGDSSMNFRVTYAFGRGEDDEIYTAIVSKQSANIKDAFEEGIKFISSLHGEKALSKLIAISVLLVEEQSIESIN